VGSCASSAHARPRLTPPRCPAHAPAHLPRLRSEGSSFASQRRGSSLAAHRRAGSGGGGGGGGPDAAADAGAPKDSAGAAPASEGAATEEPVGQAALDVVLTGRSSNLEEAQRAYRLLVLASGVSQVSGALGVLRPGKAITRQG
jgi:hypothetical protein